MSLRGDIYAYLVGVTGVTNEVSTRVYHAMAPQGTAYPYVTLTIISTTDEREMTAVSGLSNTLLQVDVWSDATATLDSAADAIRAALSGLQRTTLNSNTDLRSATLTSEREDHEVDDEGGESMLHRKTQEYSLWYARSVPTFA